MLPLTNTLAVENIADLLCDFLPEGADGRTAFPLVAAEALLWGQHAYLAS